MKLIDLRANIARIRHAFAAAAASGLATLRLKRRAKSGCVRSESKGQLNNHFQRVQLSHTLPQFEGKRDQKIYCLAGAELFADRKAYLLGYRTQRVTKRDASRAVVTR